MSSEVIVTGIRRKEPDYQRLARALLALVEELEASGQLEQVLQRKPASNRRRTGPTPARRQA